VGESIVKQDFHLKKKIWYLLKNHGSTAPHRIDGGEYNNVINNNAFVHKKTVSGIF